MRAICFDWGDTLMEEIPGMLGPMAIWPKVEATPGILALLESLDGRYPCCLATNAGESDQSLVRAALTRVGLDVYFQRIFTSHDLHLKKPDEEYFRAIEAHLGLTSNDCLMIGNSFETDANGAAGARWNAIWLMRDLPSLRCHPLFDQVITDYEGFQTAFQRVEGHEIPSLQTCCDLLGNAGIKPGLWRHVQKVALTGFVLACWLKTHGVEIDPVLVHRAGLLHDLDKPLLADDPSQHGKLSAKIVRDAGYPALERCISCHQVFQILDPDFQNESWETKILFLADKLVEKDHLVGASERIEKLILRHDDPEGRMRACEQPLLILETEVSQHLKVDPIRMLDTLHRKVDGVDLEQINLIPC